MLGKFETHCTTSRRWAMSESFRQLSCLRTKCQLQSYYIIIIISSSSSSSSSSSKGMQVTRVARECVRTYVTRYSRIGMGNISVTGWPSHATTYYMYRNSCVLNGRTLHEYVWNCTVPVTEIPNGELHGLPQQGATQSVQRMSTAHNGIPCSSSKHRRQRNSVTLRNDVFQYLTSVKRQWTMTILTND